MIYIIIFIILFSFCKLCIFTQLNMAQMILYRIFILNKFVPFYFCPFLWIKGNIYVFIENVDAVSISIYFNKRTFFIWFLSFLSFLSSFSVCTLPILLYKLCFALKFIETDVLQMIWTIKNFRRAFNGHSRIFALLYYAIEQSKFKKFKFIGFCFSFLYWYID